MATFDVYGTYLQTELPKEKSTLLLLEVKILDIMCDINPEYKQHVEKNTQESRYLYVSSRQYME